eukprot:4274766-Ditylum_brightwellii.AAC.1
MQANLKYGTDKYTGPFKIVQVNDIGNVKIKKGCVPCAIRRDFISKKRNLRIPSTHCERKENEVSFPFEMP